MYSYIELDCSSAHGAVHLAGFLLLFEPALDALDVEDVVFGAVELGDLTVVSEVFDADGTGVGFLGFF